jgi:hypothetical protein
VSKEVVAILEEKSLRRKLHENTLDTQFSCDAMVSASAHSPHQCQRYPECSTWCFPSPEHRKKFSLDFR